MVAVHVYLEPPFQRREQLCTLFGKQLPFIADLISLCHEVLLQFATQ
jgi:hypothetical protein